MAVAAGAGAGADQIANNFDTMGYMHQIYGQAVTTGTKVYETITQYSKSLEEKVALYLETTTSREVRNVAMKFFKAIPETLMCLGLMVQGKLAFISAVCWAARTVISLMPLLKALLTADSAEITKGSKEAWKNLVEQHKNFVPALAVVALMATIGVFDLLSLNALTETAIFATLTATLVSALIDSETDSNAPVRMPAQAAQQKPEGDTDGTRALLANGAAAGSSSAAPAVEFQPA